MNRNECQETNCGFSTFIFNYSLIHSYLIIQLVLFIIHFYSFIHLFTFQYMFIFMLSIFHSCLFIYSFIYYFISIHLFIHYFISFSLIRFITVINHNLYKNKGHLKTHYPFTFFGQVNSLQLYLSAFQLYSLFPLLV